MEEDSPGEVNANISTTLSGSKHCIDSLSKEELITKCKHLLTISKKAKTAKDETHSEFEKFKKDSAKSILCLEEERNSIEKNAEVLNEMVANLTENKMALVTKNESLQRQLGLLSGEVELMQKSQQDFAEQYSSLRNENDKLNTAVKKQQRVIEKFSDTKEQQNKIWQNEKAELMEKVEDYEAQLKQMIQFKDEYRDLCSEKSSLEKKFKESEIQNIKFKELHNSYSALNDEKKALDIIVENLRCDIKVLNEKLSVAENSSKNAKMLQNEELCRQNESMEQTLLTTRQELEEVSSHNKKQCEEFNFLTAEKDNLINVKENLEKENAVLSESVKNFQNDLTELKDSNSVIIEKLTLDKEEMSKKITILENETLILEKKSISNLSEEKNVLQDKVDSILKEKEAIQNDFSALESKLNSLKYENDELITFHDKERLNLHERVQENEKLRDENSRLTDEVTSLTGRNVSLLEGMEELKVEFLNEKGNIMDECASFKLKTSSLSSTISDLEEINKKLFDEREMYLKESEKLAKELTSIQSLADNNASLQAKFDSLLNEKVEIEKECSSVKCKMEVVLKRSAETEAEKEQLCLNLKELLADREVAMKEKESLQVNLDSLLQEKSSTEKELSSVKEKMELLSVEVADIQRINDELSSDVERLSSERENILKEKGQLMEQLYSANVINESNSALLQENKDLKLKIDILLEEKAKLNEDICNVRSKFESISDKYDSLTAFHEDLLNKFQDLSDKNSNLNSENDELNKKIKELNENISTLNSNSIKMKDEIESLLNEKSSLAKLTDENEAKDSKIKELSSQLANLYEDKNNIEVKMSSVLESLEESKTATQQLESSMKAKIEENVQKNAELKTYKEEVSNLKKDKEETLQRVKDLEKEIAEQRELENKMKNEVLELDKIKIGLEKELEKVSGENNDYKEELTNLNIKLNKSIEDRTKLQSDYLRLMNGHSNLSSKFEETNERRKLLESQITSSESELIEVFQVRDTLSKEISDSKDMFMEKSETVSHLYRQVEHLESALKRLKEACKKCPSCSTLDPDISEAPVPQSADASEAEGRSGKDGSASSSRTENSDLINDLNIMNQAIRERGEKISRLEDLLREKNELISTLESSVDEVQNKVTLQEAELVNKQEELKQLQDSSDSNSPLMQLEVQVKLLNEENSKLKKDLESAAHHSEKHQLASNESHTAADNHSEVMSTSTIGRAEETHRLKELEDTFEERYMKLKTVAIKLKKRLAEQNSELKASEDAKKKLSSEKEELLKKIATPEASKNIQALQAEIDRVQDQLETKIKELKESDKQLLSTASELAELKSLYAVCLEEKSLLSSTVKERDHLVVELEASCKNLRDQIATHGKELQKAHEAKSKVIEDRNVSEEKLKSEKKKITELLKELDDAKQECKKFSLFDLEMQDYERTIEELTVDVKAKETSCQELQKQICSGEEKVKSLNDQLILVRGQAEIEADRAQNFKKMSEEQKIQIDELRHKEDSLNLVIEKDKITIEKLTQEVEKQKVAVSEITAHNTHSENSLRKSMEDAEQQLKEQEGQLTKYREENQTLLNELKELKDNFEVYKVRAQTVLRQKNKTPETTLTQLNSEKEQLSSDLEAANLKNQQLQSELVALKAEVGYLGSEKDRLAQQALLASDELTRSESAFKNKLKSLQDKLDNSSAEYQRIISSMSLQTESMEKSFKGQLTSLRETRTQEVKLLENRLEEAEDKIAELKFSPKSKDKTLPPKPRSSKGHSDLEEQNFHFVPHHLRERHFGGSIQNQEDDARPVDVSNMIREEGEGSEWVEPSTHQRRYSSQGGARYSPPPLEQLITAPFPPQVVADEAMSTTSGVTEVSNKEITKLEAKLNHVETRLLHVTNLLTESEAENAKLLQLSDALKEEIRRISRNEKREKHLEHNEYLKNVVLKFMLLKRGDEKSRLVPVLKTLLQLSPEEISQVSQIAKGDESSDANSSQGWGDYLHLWSGR